MSPRRIQPHVLLLPADGPSPELVHALESTGAVIVHTAREAGVVVADLTRPDGEAALRDFRAKGHDGLITLALVDELTPAVVDAHDVHEFVTRAGLDSELGARLRRARHRHQGRAEARQRERELSNLLRITADFAASLDVRDLLHDVTRRLATDMDVERAALVALDEQREAGFIIAASDDAAVKERRIELWRYPEIREVVRTGEPVIVEDAPSHPLLVGVKEHVSSKGIHTIAALPLAVSGKVLGVLLLRTNARRQAFTPREVDFLRTVAHATAVALRNVRLLEFERGLTEREKHARLIAEERAADLARYEGYFAHLTEGIAILDEEGGVLSLNPAGAEMLDVSSVEARGRPLQALTSAGGGPLAELLREVSRGEVRRSVDVPVTTAAGRHLILSVSGAPLHERGSASILSFRDVTAARALADELRQTKDFLERLIDASVDGIVAADLSGKIIVFNRGAESIAGYTPDEAKTHLQVEALYPPGVARQIMKKLREDPRGQLSLTRQEVMNRSGERVPVDMTAAIVFEGNREVATVGIFSDLRERMELEQKLSTAEERLEASEKNAVIVALAGTAAHELNQPLTSVMGYAELLKRRLKEDDFAWRPVDIIYREAERMAEIVRKIGKITRYETKSYVGAARILDLEKATSNED
ncbi:MAG TPA: PAS domain S-box protein [Myxococcaceae bacterium]|nr:PAS domain S-box protein [Myxococcaceae bacterium]